MAQILVEVSRGLARVVANPTDREIEIVDIDQLRAGAYEDARRYWTDSLSDNARVYVKASYPEIANALDA